MKKTLYYIFNLIIILLSSCSGTNKISKFIPSEKCTDCEEFINKISILKNDSNFLNNSNYCLDFFITKGDSCLIIKHFKRQDFQESIYFYKKAIEIDTSNQEAAFKIAYLYDLLDSINEAQYYYSKINQKYLNLRNRYNNKEFPEIDVGEIKKNFIYNDSIITDFIKFGKESSITFDFTLSSSSNINLFDYLFNDMFFKKIYLKIYGNGEFETRGFYKFYNSTKTYFQGKLPDSLFKELLELLENFRFLTFHNLFEYDENGSNYFNYDSRIGTIIAMVGPGLFRITINTPDFSNSISIRGLSDDYGPWSGFTFSLKKQSYDNVKFSPISIKLYMLSILWECTFDYNLLKYKKE